MSVRKRSTLLGKVLVALKYISLILITLVCLAPIILAIVTSLKSKAEVYDLGVLQLPERLHFENYVTAFVDGNMLNGFMNTVIMLGVSLIFVILNGTMLAYIFSRFEFRGKKLLSVPTHHFTVAPTGNYHDSHHKGSWNLQRLLYPLSVHAKEQLACSCHDIVSIQRAIWNAMGGHLRGCYHYSYPNSNNIYLAPKANLQWANSGIN